MCQLQRVLCRWNRETPWDQTNEHKKGTEKVEKSKRSFTCQTRKESESEQSKSAIADHKVQYNHIINWQDAKILARSVSPMCTISKKPSGSDGVELQSVIPKYSTHMPHVQIYGEIKTTSSLSNSPVCSRCSVCSQYIIHIKILQQSPGFLVPIFSWGCFVKINISLSNLISALTREDHDWVWFFPDVSRYEIHT